MASVTPGGPAEEAGIRRGDVILRFDGRKVPDMRRLPGMVAETRIGKAVAVEVWRDKSERVELEVVLGELPDDSELAALTEPAPEMGSGGQVEELGMTLSSLTPELRTEYGLDEDLEGAVVTDLDPYGPAAEKDLQPGDVVIEVDSDPVTDAQEAANRIKQTEEEGHRVVTLLVMRGGEPMWVAVPFQR